jgi:hypothetical protein
MTHSEIAESVKSCEERMILAYAFNTTERNVCASHKDATKQADGTHKGVYYNAFSEDLVCLGKR